MLHLFNCCLLGNVHSFHLFKDPFVLVMKTASNPAKGATSERPNSRRLFEQLFINVFLYCPVNLMYQTGQEKPGIQTSLHLGKFALFCFTKLWFVCSNKT